MGKVYHREIDWRSGRVGTGQGAYQKALETARNLLSEGLAPQIVARCTNLPLETVKELM